MLERPLQHAGGDGDDARSPAITVGQLGAGFIGKVHSLAYRNAVAAQRKLGARVELYRLADARGDLADEAAAQYGWADVTPEWESIVNDPAVVLFDNAAPNDLHIEPCLAAARRGKHILCEKPLAPSPDDAYRIWQAAREAGILHLCAFVQRFIPALAHARDLIAAGELGEVLHFRSRFLMGFGLDPAVPFSWRFNRAVAGAGALGDLGSHHIDLARFLVGEIQQVSARTRTFMPHRPGGRVSNDDAFVAIAELEGGATATFEASRIAGNHNVTSRVEIDGSKGSLAFDFERLNELTVAERGRPGFRTFLVTGASHPYSDFWFPVGIQGQHPIGWADLFTHQAHAMLSSIADGAPSLPESVPTFRDGYRVAEVVATIEHAAEEKQWLRVPYRE